MRKYFLLFLAVMLLGVGCGVSKKVVNKPTDDKKITEVNKGVVKDLSGNDQIKSDIAKFLAGKYKLDEKFVSVTVSQVVGDYARGMVSLAEGQGGGWWLGAKLDGKWIAVQDGNGTVDCDLTGKMKFPMELTPDCESVVSDKQDSNKSISVLEEIKNETSLIQWGGKVQTVFDWNESVADKVNTKKISGEMVTTSKGYKWEEFATISKALKDKGYVMDMYNVADGTFVGLEGYRKDNNVCLIRKFASNDMTNFDPNKWDGNSFAELKCGNLN